MKTVLGYRRSESMCFGLSTVEKFSANVCVHAGQHLPASSEDDEECRGQNEEPLQLSGMVTFLSTSLMLQVCSSDF